MTVVATVNGKPVELPRTISLADFIAQRKLTGRRIAVAHNGAVVARERLPNIMITDGDVVEIVRPVGGG